jgi:phage terminase small subunit
MASPASNVSRIRPPPPHLGPHGAALWRSVVRDYEVNNEAQLVHLEVAAGALDRLEQCREIIRTEGLVLDDKRVGKIAHPLLKVENACRSAFQSAMRALRLAPSVERGG